MGMWLNDEPASASWLSAEWGLAKGAVIGRAMGSGARGTGW